jgi:two-component system OmpR family response regulator
MSAKTDIHALIVDDTQDFADMIMIALGRAGIQADYAPGGRWALEYLAKQTPDVLLLDIGMPEMNGWQVLEVIKTQYADTDFPIIIMTAFGDPANKLIGKLQSRVFRYLTKPFEPKALVDTIREAISAQQSILVAS